MTGLPPAADMIGSAAEVVDASPMFRLYNWVRHCASRAILTVEVIA
jgi:hypothetical protein